jgi:hypothetical protein
MNQLVFRGDRIVNGPLETDARIARPFASLACQIPETHSGVATQPLGSGPVHGIERGFEYGDDHRELGSHRIG